MNDSKIYYSFNEVPFDNKPYQDSNHSLKIRFSPTEIKHILISIAVLTVAFAFAFSRYPGFVYIEDVIQKIPFSFLAIVTAFFCHEMAHKYMGQKYGYWSEFRMYTQGLLFALFLGIFIGIVFAAPGAVQIFGNPDREKMGKISIAGPATNIVISIIFIGIAYFTSGLIPYIAYFIAYINIFLALFNLLPFGPFDGMKIYHWRKDVWISSIGLALIILIFLMTYLNNFLTLSNL